MCLGIPARLLKIEGPEGVADLRGVQHRIRLDLIDSPQVGDYVLLHAGFAIQRLDMESAQETLNLLGQVIYE